MFLYPNIVGRIYGLMKVSPVTALRLIAVYSISLQLFGCGQSTPSASSGDWRDKVNSGPSVKSSTVISKTPEYTFKEEYWFDPNSSVYDPAYKGKPLRDKCEIIAGRWESNKANWEADDSELWKESANNNVDDMSAIGCASIGLQRPRVGSEPVGDYQAYLSAVTEVRKGVTKKIVAKMEAKGVTWNSESDPSRIEAIRLVEAEMRPNVYDSAPKTLTRSQLDGLWQEIKDQINANL